MTLEEAKRLVRDNLRSQGIKLGSVKASEITKAAKAYLKALSEEASA